MKASEISEATGSGLLISYDSSEELLSFLSGPVQVDLVAAGVSEPDRNYQPDMGFQGEIKAKSGNEWNLFVKSDWNPNGPAMESVLNVKGLEKLRIQELPDSQPDKPLNLFVDGALVDQDLPVVTWENEPNPGSESDSQDQSDVMGWLRENQKTLTLAGAGGSVVLAGYLLSRGGE